MYFLGVDVSTTATKALLIGEDGRVRAVAASEYSFETPQPLWCEQSPARWWEGTLSSVRSVLQLAQVNPADIGAVGLTGQMHGLVLLGAGGEVLRPCILWNDQRTQAQCQEIHRRIGSEEFMRITGNPALTGFTLPKLLWVREHEPDIYAAIRHVLLPKDYIRYLLSGEFATDAADASGTVLLDLKARRWSHELLEQLDIPSSWFPAIYEGPQPTGRVHSAAAASVGLKEGTLVVAGGSDQAAQAVGVGAVSQGIVALTLGTSGVVFASTRQPLVEAAGRLHAFCHSLPGRWHLMGVMLSAAGSLRWLRDSFAAQAGYEELLASCQAIPAGSDGLLFLPYLTGERTPHADPLARAAFVGLTVRHSLPHLTRAVLEGVAFGLRDSFELMKASGLGKIEKVRVSGGGARSSLWRQILAEVCNADLETVSTEQGAAYGAALLAGTGAGVWPDVEAACRQSVKASGLVRPSSEQADVYERLYQTYRGLYPALKPAFEALA